MESTGERVELAKLGAELPLLMDIGESRAEEGAWLSVSSEHWSSDLQMSLFLRS